MQPDESIRRHEALERQEDGDASAAREDGASGSGGTRTLRDLVASTPWFAIAVLLHVMVIAVASVVLLAQRHGQELAAPETMAVRPTKPVVSDPIEPPPTLPKRDEIPFDPLRKSGDVDSPLEPIPDADPGRTDEITDEADVTKDAGHLNPDPTAIEGAPSGEQGGTPIGVGLVGHVGTGVPTAYSTRAVGFHGKGHGGPGGNGGGGPPNGTPRGVTESTLAALTWLAKHQSPDGRWDADGFDAQCKGGEACGGKGDALNDVGLTGLALLCFLGAGDTQIDGPFKRSVRSGLLFLRGVQDADGCFGTKSGKSFQYNHACAALAMAEAFGMTQTPMLHDPAQKGLDFVMKSRNPYKAWRYGVADGDNDVSVTGWMVMALKSGKMAGLAVEESAIRDAAAFVDELTDPASGRTGYQQRGTPPARSTEMLAKFPAEKSESLTAVGMLVRIFAGHGGNDDKFIGMGADLLASTPPKWDETSGSIDLYYWYYGSLAMHQVGDRRWNRWNEAMKTALLDHQHMDSKKCSYGSWDPIDPWSLEGGRVYATALNCLSTEVYYRYPRVFGAKSAEPTAASK